jgi:hypothetical protein
MKFLIKNRQYQPVTGYSHCIECPFNGIDRGVLCGNIGCQYYDCFNFELIQSTSISMIFKL